MRKVSDSRGYAGFGDVLDLQWEHPSELSQSLVSETLEKAGRRGARGARRKPMRPGASSPSGRDSLSTASFAASSRPASSVAVSRPISPAAQRSGSRGARPRKSSPSPRHGPAVYKRRSVLGEQLPPEQELQQVFHGPIEQISFSDGLQAMLALASDTPVVERFGEEPPKDGHRREPGEEASVAVQPGEYRGPSRVQSLPIGDVRGLPDAGRWACYTQASADPALLRSLSPLKSTKQPAPLRVEQQQQKFLVKGGAEKSAAEVRRRKKSETDERLAEDRRQHDLWKGKVVDCAKRVCVEILANSRTRLAAPLMPPGTLSLTG